MDVLSLGRLGVVDVADAQLHLILVKKRGSVSPALGPAGPGGRGGPMGTARGPASIKRVLGALGGASAESPKQQWVGDLRGPRPGGLGQ